MNVEEIRDELKQDYKQLVSMLSKDEKLNLSIEEIKDMINSDEYVMIANHCKLDKNKILIEFVSILVEKKKNKPLDDYFKNLNIKEKQEYEKLKELKENNFEEFEKYSRDLDEKFIKNTISSNSKKYSGNLSGYIFLVILIAIIISIFT